MIDFFTYLLETLEHLSHVLPSCLEQLAKILLAFAIFVIFSYHLIEFMRGLMRSRQTHKPQETQAAEHPPVAVAQN